jgi:hypothetical protein
MGPTSVHSTSAAFSGESMPPAAKATAEVETEVTTRTPAL